MKRIKLLAFVLLTLVGSCEKNRDHSRASVTFTGKGGFFPLNSLIPDLDGLEVQEKAYCLSTEPQVIDTTYTNGRIWLPAHTQTNTATIPSFTIPSPFEEGIETSIGGSFPVIVPDFQWDADILDVEYGMAEGTVTLHFSYPESFPFEQIHLHSADIELPGFLRVDPAQDGVVRIDRKAVKVRGDWAIPRSGRDLSLTVDYLVTDNREVQENGWYSVRGELKYSLTVSVKPEDAIGDVSGTWEQVPVEIAVVSSDIDMTRANVRVAQSEPDEKPVRRSTPFPTLKEERLNHFSLVQVLRTYESDEYVSTYGIREFVGWGWKVNFFSCRGAAERSVSLGDPYPGRYFYKQDDDWIYREGYTDQVVKQLNSLVADPVPDEIGFSVKHTIQNDIWVNQTCHRKYSVQWRVPLRLSGVNWQKEIETEPLPVSANDMDSYPGSVIHVGFALQNAQPFDISGYPVVIDAEGNHHEFKDKSFHMKGGSTFVPTSILSDFDWIAEEPARRIQVYFRLILEECSSNLIAPGQGIEYSLTFVNKEILPGK